MNWTSVRSDFNVSWKKIKTNIQNSILKSSFDALSKWHDPHIRNELCNKKVVISEPRFADEFESSMRHFYEVIESTTNYTKEGVNGALFIAVCRGKVSEGVIFLMSSRHKTMKTESTNSEFCCFYFERVNSWLYFLSNVHAPL